jgi:uncharacterized protein (DUF4415 family)
MPKSAKGIRSNLRKLDAYRLRREDYDEAPELTDQQLATAKHEVAGKPVRGRPRLTNPKLAIKLRIDADVIRHFRSTGVGWQTRINDTLRRAVKRKVAR